MKPTSRDLHAAHEWDRVQERRLARAVARAREEEQARAKANLAALQMFTEVREDPDDQGCVW